MCNNQDYNNNCAWCRQIRKLANDRISGCDENKIYRRCPNSCL